MRTSGSRDVSRPRRCSGSSSHAQRRPDAATNAGISEVAHKCAHSESASPVSIGRIAVRSNPVLPTGRLVRETKRAPQGRCPPLSFLIRKRRRVRGTAEPCRASDRHHAGPESITLLRGRRSPIFFTSRKVASERIAGYTTTRNGRACRWAWLMQHLVE